jgi:hypothetical protein
MSAPGAEDGAVADVAVEWVAAAEGVVGLGQPPDVVVADGLGVAVADADLVVQGPGGVVPHVLQEAQAELRLGGEVGVGRAGAQLGGEVAHAELHHGDGIAGGLDEFQVVAGVPPAARDVDAHAERREVAREAPIVVHVRRQVGHGDGVVEVAGRAAQGRGDVGGPIALILIERQPVGERAGIQVGRRVHLEAGGGRGDGPADRDGVGARRRHAVEIQRIDHWIGSAPLAEAGADGPGGHGRAARVLDAERRPGLGGRGHQVGAFAGGGRVAELVDADGGRAARRAGWPRSQGECQGSGDRQTRDQDAGEERDEATS